MNRDKLDELIRSLTCDIEFGYNGKDGAICPFNAKKISLGYGDYEIDVDSFERAMSEPFIDGKSLNEIAELLEIY